MNIPTMCMQGRTGLSGAILLVACLLLGCRSTPPSSSSPAQASPAWRAAESRQTQAQRFSASERWAEAADAWESAAQQFTLLNDRAREAVAWHNAGLAWKRLGQFDKAQQSLERAAAINTALASPHSDAWWRNQIALQQLRAVSGEKNNLRRQWEELLAADSSQMGPETRGHFSNEYGLWLWRQDRLEEASARLKEARTAMERANSLPGQASVAANQALVLEAEGLPSEAHRHWSWALTQFEKLGNPEGIARCLAGLGRTLTSVGGTREEAQSLLDRAAHNRRLLGLPEAAVKPSED